MVLLEALARRRPVIVFEDISHVIGLKILYQRETMLIFGINNIKKNYKLKKRDEKNIQPTKTS